MKTVTITLTNSELLIYSCGGTFRNVSAIKDRRSMEGRMDKGFDSHVCGCYGEAALAKYLNVFYVPLVGALDTDLGDVAGQYQVRSTPYYPNGHLPMKERDRKHFPYVLALIILPTIVLAGWIEGQRGWEISHLDPKGYRKVFQEQLRPMDTLPPLINPSGKVIYG